MLNFRSIQKNVRKFNCVYCFAKLALLLTLIQYYPAIKVYKLLMMPLKQLPTTKGLQLSLYHRAHHYSFILAFQHLHHTSFPFFLCNIILTCNPNTICNKLIYYNTYTVSNQLDNHCTVISLYYHVTM